MNDCSVCGTSIEDAVRANGNVEDPCPMCGSERAPLKRPRARVQVPAQTKTQRAAAKQASNEPADGAPITALPASISERSIGSADKPWTAQPAPAASPLKTSDGRLPLWASIAAGIAAAIVAGASSAAVTYSTRTIWYYEYALYGLIIGIAFQYRSQPLSWRVRSCLAPAVTLLSLFFSEYFLTRALVIDVMTNRGVLLPGEAVPLLLSPPSMIRVVADVFTSHPVNYFIWGFAIYLAYSVPSARHRADKKRTKTQASA